METEEIKPVEFREATFEVYLEYIKSVEKEFSESADEVLESLNLSHLRKKPGQAN